MSEARFCRIHASLLGAASLAATATLVALATGTAHAQTVYLVGADFYSSSSNGTDLGPSSYLYDTNNSTAGTSTLALTVNGTSYGKGISIALAPGANNFTFIGVGNVQSPGSYAGLGLFFSTTNVSYNPTSNARTPDLSLASSVGPGFSGDFTPANGISVANYVFGATSPANGLTSIAQGPTTVSESSFTAAAQGVSGSFVVNAGSGAAAPEPGSLVLFGTFLAPLAGLVARRRYVAKTAGTPA